MNHDFKSPLVDCARGGVNGGGARLTPLGEDVLARYQRIVDKALRATARDVDQLRTLIR